MVSQKVLSKAVERKLGGISLLPPQRPRRDKTGRPKREQPMAHQAPHNRLGETKPPGMEEPDRQRANASEERMRHAEEWVDQIGARVGEATAYLGHQLLRLGARLREEAEDIWAEAQNLRRGQRS
jgi:hypothetical protein